MAKIISDVQTKVLEKLERNIRRIHPTPLDELGAGLNTIKALYSRGFVDCHGGPGSDGHGGWTITGKGLQALRIIQDEAVLHKIEKPKAHRVLEV